MEIEGYLLGSPPPVGPSFGWPPPLFGARLTTSLLPSLPACSPCSLLLPAHSPCSYPCSQLAPLASNGQGRVGVCYTMFWGPRHLCGGKRLGGKLGARAVRGSKLGVRGSRLEARGSETNVILGFRVPTTSGRKNFDDDI